MVGKSARGFCMFRGPFRKDFRYCFLFLFIYS